jgi:probable HAF family extracellular repeat protein
VLVPGIQRVTPLEEITVSDQWDWGSIRLITLLSATMALGMAACTSEETLTEPSASTSPAEAVAGTYTAVDLGTLPGGNLSSARAINSAGQVAGVSGTAGGDNHAVLWKNGDITDLGTLGGSSSEAFGINNAGQVVGKSETAEGEFHAFLWEKGVMTDLGTPGGTSSAAIDINARGQILVGGSDGSVGVWERGIITSLALPAGSSGCTPTGINAAGRVVGQCGVGQSIRSELWDRAAVTDLGTLGGSVTAATAISASGRVIGISREQPDEGSRPFLWERGTMTNLSTQGAPNGFIPNAINAAGQIVGINATGGQLHATLWHHGATVDLGALPGEDTYAFDINAAGQVVGQTVGGNGTHATLWTRK